MSKRLPDSDHVLRYVPWQRLIKAEDEATVIGVFPQAFDLRAGEEYLSVTWVEYFDAPTICDRVCTAVRAIRGTIKAGKQSRFLMGNVGAVHGVCQRRDRKVRILHEPDENPGHVAVRRFPRDDLQLMTMLVADAFTAHVDSRDVP